MASCYLGFALDPSHKETMTRMPRGQCTLPADDAGRIWDRLAGLEQVIRPEDIRHALTATGRLKHQQPVVVFTNFLGDGRRP